MSVKKIPSQNSNKWIQIEQEQAKIWKSMKSVAGRVCIDTRNKSKQKNDKQNQASASISSDE